jgi:hypothetical protein
MMTNRTELPARNPNGYLFGIYLLALAVCLMANLGTRIAARADWGPPWGRIIVAAVSVVPLMVAAALLWRMLRRDLDEMLQRVMLEGMAFALVVYIPLAALYVNLKTAGAWTPRLDPPDILLAPAILVAVGVALAWRRYQ